MVRRKVARAVFLAALVVSVVVVALSQITSAQAQSVGPTEGFRDMRWGENLSAHPEMVLIGANTAMKFYTRTNEKMSIGDALMDDIWYGFCDGEFCCVEINFSGFRSFDEMKSVMVARHGTPKQPNLYVKSFYWLNDPKFTGILGYSEITKKGSVTLADQHRWDKSQAAGEARQAKGAKDM
jgi:hypothetical protein